MRSWRWHHVVGLSGEEEITARAKGRYNDDRRLSSQGLAPTVGSMHCVFIVEPTDLAMGRSPARNVFWLQGFVSVQCDRGLGWVESYGVE